MKKGLKITLIIIGVILLILLNICVGAILINNDKTKKMLDDYSNIYTNDKYQEVVSVDNLNYIKQDISCGYAVIEMFAKWRGNEEITEKYLYDKYGKVVTSTGKSFEEEMNKQFPEFKTTMYKNLKSSELIDKVYDSLLKGVPVPFEWAAKYEDKWTLHYSVISAMDIPNDKVTVMNPYGYEENISIKEFIDRTSFEAYDHMPIIFKLGFAFNIFEKNTVFIVDMPQVLGDVPGMDGTPSVGSLGGNGDFTNKPISHVYERATGKLDTMKLSFEEDLGVDKSAMYRIDYCPAKSSCGRLVEKIGEEKGEVVHAVTIELGSEDYSMVSFRADLSSVSDEDNIEVYRSTNYYDYEKVNVGTSYRKSVDFSTKASGVFVFVKTN